MKTPILLCALLASTTLASSVMAQRYYDPRIDVPRIVNADRDIYDRDRGGDWELRVRGELSRLNAEVEQVRREIGDSRDRRVRAHFHEIRRATYRLNYAYERRMIRGWEVRRRADEIRAELASVRREMRYRYDARGWR